MPMAEEVCLLNVFNLFFFSSLSSAKFSRNSTGSFCALFSHSLLFFIIFIYYYYYYYFIYYYFNFIILFKLFIYYLFFIFSN